jgi:hypothetical protein
MSMNKKWSKIDRMYEACILFSQGKLTLEQVHRRVKGPKRTEIILSYPNVGLGHLLYALSCDFYTWYEDRNDIIERQIFLIVNYLSNPLKLEANNELETSDTPVLH